MNTINVYYLNHLHVIHLSELHLSKQIFKAHGHKDLDKQDVLYMLLNLHVVTM